MTSESTLILPVCARFRFNESGDVKVLNERSVAILQVSPPDSVPVGSTARSDVISALNESVTGSSFVIVKEVSWFENTVSKLLKPFTQAVLAMPRLSKSEKTKSDWGSTTLRPCEGRWSACVTVNCRCCNSFQK